MRRLLLFSLIALAGCSGNDSPIARAAGSWPGSFQSETAKSGGDVVKGNLELYATGMKFLLDMKTEHQGFTVRGKWSVSKSRATLVADSFTFDNPREEDQKALGLKLISPDEIRSAFGHALILDETHDKRKMIGLRVSLGSRIGRFEFERPIPH